MDLEVITTYIEVLDPDLPEQNLLTELMHVLYDPVTVFCFTAPLPTVNDTALRTS